MAGCSTAFVYNRLDTFAGWYLESLVSLNDGQRTEMRSWLERTLAWHRKSELTRYAAFLSDVSTTIEQPGTAESYEVIRVRFQGLIDDLITKTAPEASQLLTRLSPAQVDELLDNLEEKAQESKEDDAQSVADNKWKPGQTKSIARQVKRWTGSVSTEQKNIIAEHVNELEPTYADWADSQQAWRDALRDALRSQEAAESDEASPRVLQLLEDPDKQWTADYSTKVARNRARYQQMVLALDATLSTEQRKHLSAELLKLSQQLTRLARS